MLIEWRFNDYWKGARSKGMQLLSHTQLKIKIQSSIQFDFFKSWKPIKSPNWEENIRYQGRKSFPAVGGRMREWHISSWQTSPSPFLLPACTYYPTLSSVPTKHLLTTTVYTTLIPRTLLLDGVCKTDR